jgi:hypothetical protein
LWEDRTRELKTLELEAVSGAAVAPRPVPVIPKTILGVRLSKQDRLVLAAVISLLRPRKPAA